MRLSERYHLNKETKTGAEIVCPVCGAHFKKRQYSQAFCSGECKDRFWNAVNPRGFALTGGMTDRDWDDAYGVAEYND